MQLKASAAETGIGLALSWLYLPGLLNASTAGRWAFASLALPLLVSVKPPGLVIAWLAYSAASLLWSFDPWTGVGHLWWLSIFVMASAARCRLPEIAFGASLGLLLQLPLILAQIYGWQALAQIPPGPAGLFLNKNFLGEAAALCCVLMAMQKRPLLALALAAIVAFTKCREAELGLGVAALVWLLRDYPWSTAGLIVVLAAGLFIVADPTSLAARDLGYRLVMWQASLTHLTFFGHGIGSFYALYPAFGDISTFGRPDHPHSELILAIFELGMGALAPLAFGVLAFIRTPFARPVLSLAAVECIFGFPLQVPTTCVLLGLLAGTAFRRDARTLRGLGYSGDSLPARSRGRHGARGPR